MERLTFVLSFYSAFSVLSKYRIIHFNEGQMPVIVLTCSVFKDSIVFIHQVLMKDGQPVSEGEKIAQDLMEKLQVSSDCLIAGAYMDLILAQRENGTH